MFDSIKRYYDKGLYDPSDVKIFVRAGWITETQYTEITGETYTI